MNQTTCSYSGGKKIVTMLGKLSYGHVLFLKLKNLVQLLVCQSCVYLFTNCSIMHYQKLLQAKCGINLQEIW